MAPPNRSDSVAEKMQLFKSAYESGKLDLALSLAASIRDTLHLEKQLARQALDVPVDSSLPVDQLPAPWATWGRGWKFFRAITLYDSTGIHRAPELAELFVGFAPDQISDVYRELRVARIEADGTLREIPSQVYDEARSQHRTSCRLAFVAEAPMHDTATYLLLHGNPNAQLPDYKTDMRISGDGYGLEIETQYYRAILSKQEGQLERLIIKREHGLELYAGGKGHGEPPGIDWAHDYVDEGGFQKLRMRNWPQCPNYEVQRGSLFTRIRRWGFPYSPLHPVHTPSRMHMDQTYTFIAGLPYFLKTGRIDAVKNVSIDAMRDDEWVFSGYSFTDLLWFDEQGRLNVGAPPPESINRLWGAGFFHRVSQDAFVALWLKHEARGTNIDHSGPPTLQYAGHGQLWSRYPAQHTKLSAGTTLFQENAYVVLPYAGDADRERIETLRHQLLNPLKIGLEAKFEKSASCTGTLARFGETPETAVQKTEIWQALREVKDEQLYTMDSNIVDLGYVYDVRLRDAIATVVVTMPHRGRPVYQFLEFQGGGRVTAGIRETLLKIAGIRHVNVEFTWNPPWTIARLSDAAREALGIG